MKIAQTSKKRSSHLAWKLKCGIVEVPSKERVKRTKEGRDGESPLSVEWKKSGSKMFSHPSIALLHHSREGREETHTLLSFDWSTSSIEGEVKERERGSNVLCFRLALWVDLFNCSPLPPSPSSVISNQIKSTDIFLIEEATNCNFVNTVNKIKN